MSVRKVIKIDEEKCNGCGLCVPSCAEGAIQIIDGKAKLVSETYCDGLGACLGECPQDAITMEDREAPDFNEVAVKKHLAKVQLNPKIPAVQNHHHEFSGCPSARVMSLKKEEKKEPKQIGHQEKVESNLGQWPIKLKLVPPGAPFLEDADLMLIADCMPFAYTELHQKFLPDHAIVIGCPKFDDYELSINRLTEILKHSSIKSLTVVHMEVPCCFGFWHMAEEAIKDSGKDIPLYQAIIGISGDIKQATKPNLIKEATYRV